MAESSGRTLVTSVLFTGANASSSVAKDLEEGFTDRLRSLPVSDPARYAGFSSRVEAIKDRLLALIAELKAEYEAARKRLAL